MLIAIVIRNSRSRLETKFQACFSNIVLTFCMSAISRYITGKKHLSFDRRSELRTPTLGFSKLNFHSRRNRKLEEIEKLLKIARKAFIFPKCLVNPSKAVKKPTFTTSEYCQMYLHQQLLASQSLLCFNCD